MARTSACRLTVLLAHERKGNHIAVVVVVAVMVVFKAHVFRYQIGSGNQKRNRDEVIVFKAFVLNSW